MEKNSGERLYRKLLPTFYSGHAVGKNTLGTYGEVLTTANDLTIQEIYTLYCCRRIVAIFAGSSLAAIKTLTGLKSDTVVYHYTNNSIIVFSSIRRLSTASQPPRVSLVSIPNYYTPFDRRMLTKWLSLLSQRFGACTAVPVLISIV